MSKLRKTMKRKMRRCSSLGRPQEGGGADVQVKEDNEKEDVQVKEDHEKEEEDRSKLRTTMTRKRRRCSS